jgi:hypothetical protein
MSFSREKNNKIGSKFFFIKVDMGMKKSVILRLFHNGAFYLCNKLLSKVRVKKLDFYDILFSETVFWL